MQPKQQIFREAYAHSDHFYYVEISMEGLYLHVNTAFSDRFGFIIEQLEGSPFVRLVHPDDIVICRKASKMLLLNPTIPQKILIRKYHPFGEYYTSEWQLHAVLDEQRNCCCICCVGSDLTTTYYEKASLKYHNHIFSSILDSITDVVYVLDHQFLFKYANKALVHFCMAKRVNDVIERSIWLLFPELKELLFYEMFQQAMTEKTTIHFREFIPMTQRWMSISVYPYQDGLVVLSRDISEKVKNESKLENRNAALRKVAWLQSHAVRRPLSNIMGLVQLIALDGKQEELPHLLSLLNVSATQLDEVIRKVMAVTYVEK